MNIRMTQNTAQAAGFNLGRVLNGVTNSDFLFTMQPPVQGKPNIAYNWRQTLPVGAGAQMSPPTNDGSAPVRSALTRMMASPAPTAAQVTALGPRSVGTATAVRVPTSGPTMLLKESLQTGANPSARKSVLASAVGRPQMLQRANPFHHRNEMRTAGI